VAGARSESSSNPQVAEARLADVEVLSEPRNGLIALARELDGSLAELDRV
jgi:hypothetical protein